MKSKIVSTRGYFNLQTGELSSSHNIADYDYSDVPGLGGNPCPDNNELAIYIHEVCTGEVALKNSYIEPSYH